MQHATLLVIGGSGFYGKSILDAHRRGRLARFGIGRVLVLSRHASALLTRHPELLGPDVECLEADVTSADALPPADIVIHAAASTDARRYAADPAGERANIVAGIAHYGRLALRHHRHSRIVYASSGAVYGGQAPDEPGLAEDVALRPLETLAAGKRDYAAAKRVAEDEVARLGTLGLSVAIARGFGFVGHYLPRDQHFAIGNFLEDGLRGRAIRVQARHPVIRSYLHADDLVTALLTMAGAAAPGAPIYNVGSAEAVEVRALAAAVASRFGVGVEAPPPVAEPIDRYVPDVRAARERLGLVPEFGLESALDDIVRRLRASALHP